MLFILAVAVCISICVTRKLVKPLIELNTAAQENRKWRFGRAADLPLSMTKLVLCLKSFRQTVAHLKHYIDYIKQSGLSGFTDRG